MTQYLEVIIPDNELKNLAYYEKTNRFVLFSDTNTELGQCRIFRTLNQSNMVELLLNNVLYYIYQYKGNMSDFNDVDSDFRIQNNILSLKLNDEIFNQFGL